MAAPPDFDAAAVTSKLGVDMDAELVTLALTHRSYAYENGGLPTNERLEFLGDAVLGVVVTERLYRDNPELPEGQLAKLRACVVNMNALAAVARRIRLGESLRLGRGEEMTGGRDKASLLADALEAVIGAVYLQHGFAVATDVVLALVGESLTSAGQLGAGLDWKTSLQERCAELGLGVPDYRVTSTGPDHDKTFAAQVFLADIVRGDGGGKTKKEAEQHAAHAAFEAIADGHA